MKADSQRINAIYLASQFDDVTLDELSTATRFHLAVHFDLKKVSDSGFIIRRPPGPGNELKKILYRQVKLLRLRGPSELQARVSRLKLQLDLTG